MLADVFGEGADVGAGAAVDLDFKLGVVVAQDFDGVDFDLSCWDFEIFICSGEFVGALAVDFNGAEFWWSLDDFAYKCLERQLDVA